jgi:hypothetical protein
MADQPNSEAGLQAFLEAAGRSLAGAQSDLTGSSLQTDLVIANAELEAKVTLKTDSSGKLSVQPVSAQDVQLANLNAAGISTLRVSFVATAGEIPPGTSATKPELKPAEVIDSVRSRPDVISLEKILGPLNVETVFVPETKRWVVTAHDARGRLVREAIVPDQTT